MARLTYVTLVIVMGIVINAADAQTNGKAGSRSRLLTGVVTAVSTSALTIGRGQHEMVFDVDSSTRFIGKQKNAAARDLVLRERRVTDFVKVGDKVMITYRQSRGAMNAVEVRVAPR